MAFGYWEKSNNNAVIGGSGKTPEGYKSTIDALRTNLFSQRIETQTKL